MFFLNIKIISLNNIDFTTMSQDKLSIVIACYNDQEYLAESVESAYAQKWENKEIILVDDGSNPATKAVIQNLTSKIDKLITQENKGVSAARNKGISVAAGEYILILDSDDYFEPDFSKKAIEILENNPFVKLVSCYATWFNTQSSKIFKPPGGLLTDFLIKNCVLSVLYRKNDFLKINGYDENMKQGYEDWEFYIRLLQNGGEAKVIPEVLFNYRNKPASRNKKANLKKYELLEYIYLKHQELYKEHFPYFITEWLDSVKKSEAFKQQVMDSPDYKIGYNLLRPFRYLGFFKKNKS